MSRHRFHGGPERFAVIARFVADRFGRSVHHIAVVAGGQGMLARVPSKKYNYAAEANSTNFDAKHASFYDLVIGLHPDEATGPKNLALVSTPPTTT